MKIKKGIALALAVSMMVAIVGCSSQVAEGTDENDYVAIGEIIGFEEGKVHVLSGDVADVYVVEDTVLENYYLGQTVSVNKLENGKLTLDEFQNKDYSVKHTNMGHIIYTIKGELSLSSDRLELTVKNELEEKTFELNEELYLNENALISVDYIIFDDGPVFLEYYNEETKIDLTVNKVLRTDSGDMVIETTTENEIEYIVTINNATEVMFNYTELQEGTKVTVYGPEVMLTVYPNQMTAKKIILLKK